jgi:hypothetical protein
MKMRFGAIKVSFSRVSGENGLKLKNDGFVIEKNQENENAVSGKNSQF